MNEKAMYDLTYGLFLIGTKADGKENACITNTVIQLASSPARVSLSCIKGNLTPELIEKSGRFTCTILDETAPFALFRNFGLQHGRDTDKFEGYRVQYDEAGMPYIKDHACALLSCRVISCEDLGSHILFIAEVTDAEKLSFVRPVTYAEYHTSIKPKKTEQKKEKKQIGWRCEICGYVYEDTDLPDDFICPWCGHPTDDFAPLYED